MFKEDGFLRILAVEPEKPPKAVEIEHTVEAMEAVVGGPIQDIYPFDDEVALIVNEEGKLRGLAMNRELRNKAGVRYDILCGTFFVIGAPNMSDSFTSLTGEQIRRYSEMFASPEMFFKLNGKIISLPFDEALRKGADLQ